MKQNKRMRMLEVPHFNTDSLQVDTEAITKLVFEAKQADDSFRASKLGDNRSTGPRLKNQT
jgi:hypothetical protein